MIAPIVCVPAKNEAERLPSLVRALQRQTWLEAPNRRLQMVLVLNNCTDNSREAVAQTLQETPDIVLHLTEVHFAPQEAHVGSARRVAMNNGFALAPNNSVLLSTDADAVPRRDWIEANLRAIVSGADLVGGHVVGDKHEETLLGPKFVRRAARHLHYAKLVDYLASLGAPRPDDPWPRHSDHTGASLAVRSEVYAAVGGIPAIPFQEDIAFVEKVCRAGYRLRHPLDVHVTVSARLDGRATRGMADCIKFWKTAAESGAPHLVEHPRAIIVRLCERHSQHSAAIPLTEQNAMDHGRLQGQSFKKDGSDGKVEIELAISTLEQLIADNEGKNHVTGAAALDFLQSVD